MLITYIVEVMLGTMWLPVSMPGMAVTDEAEALGIARDLHAEMTDITFRVTAVTYRAERVYPQALNIHRWVETGRTHIDIA